MYEGPTATRDFYEAMWTTFTIAVVVINVFLGLLDGFGRRGSGGP